MIKRPYQCGIAVYQLAKLRMLEFYYDFLDKYLSRQDFKLCYMDTDSFYLAPGDTERKLNLHKTFRRRPGRLLNVLCTLNLRPVSADAMSGDSRDEIVRPEMKQAYEADKKNWLATDKFSERRRGLFKPEFAGTRGVWLTAKCYLIQHEANENKYSCKGVSKKHNDLHFQRYKDVLDVFLKTRRDTELEEKDIDKAKNVGFRVYNQGVVT